MIPVLFAILWSFTLFTRGYSTPFARSELKLIAPQLDIPNTIQELLANYAPYFDAGNYTDPPEGCSIKQVNIIQRHGARFPTSNSNSEMQNSLSKLQNADEFNDPRLDFLQCFTYDLESDSLVPFGAAQSFDAGQVHFSRYSGLVNTSYLPFVRASGSQRVIDSATNWSAGVFFASQGTIGPAINVIIPEDSNDTLANGMCPNAGSAGPQVQMWQAIYTAPIMAYLNTAAPGANLGPADVTNIMALCPFETVAKETLSPFCALFNQSDFEGFEYIHDLSEYYSKGYGQELGPVQGIGYVNELLARLTGQHVQGGAQINQTLDSSPLTFPLNRTFYIDFSHDDEMIAIYSAIGLFQQAQPLNASDPNPQRTWVNAKLVPFSGRMTVERLDCDAEAFVRIFVNDALQPLDFCGGDKNGLCSLDAFAKSQGFAQSNGAGKFDMCN